MIAGPTGAGTAGPALQEAHASNIAGLRTHLEPAFGNERVTAITRERVRDFLAAAGRDAQACPAPRRT